MNTVTFYIFLNNFLEKYPNQKFLLVMDNIGYHKTDPILDLIKQNKNKIKIEFPPYSPELNPTETCWKTIRSDVTNSVYYPTLEKLMQGIDQFNENHFFNLNVLNYLCP